MNGRGRAAERIEHHFHNIKPSSHHHHKHHNNNNRTMILPLRIPLPRMQKKQDWILFLSVIWTLVTLLLSYIQLDSSSSSFLSPDVNFLFPQQPQQQQQQQQQQRQSRQNRSLSGLLMFPPGGDGVRIDGRSRESSRVSRGSRGGKIAVAIPSTKDWSHAHKGLQDPHYGDIKYHPVPFQDFKRSINLDDHIIYSQIRKQYLKALEESVTDEDVDEADPHRYEPYDEITYEDWRNKRAKLNNTDDDKGYCYRGKWTYEVHPSCLDFHEHSLDRTAATWQNYEFSYIASGYFRNTWRLTDVTSKSVSAGVNTTTATNDNNDDAAGIIDAVMKTNRIFEWRNFRPYDYSQTAMEALVMLKSHSSNRTMNVYGYCGTSVLVEPGEPNEKKIIPNDYTWYEQDKLNKRQTDSAGNIIPMNNITSMEKLQIAIDMAEGLAQMHGNSDGPIISHDLGFDQWLISKKDGLVKMNDFNKARILYYNPIKHKYCTTWSHQSDSYRSPEEIHGGYIDDSADMNAFGKFMYTIMTGLRPYYTKFKSKVANEAVVAGEMPYIDPRYRNPDNIIEKRMAEIMERCYKFKQEDRATIFEVVAHLHETARIVQEARANASSSSAAQQQQHSNK